MGLVRGLQGRADAARHGASPARLNAVLDEFHAAPIHGPAKAIPALTPALQRPVSIVVPTLAHHAVVRPTCGRKLADAPR